MIEDGKKEGERQEGGEGGRKKERKKKAVGEEKKTNKRTERGGKVVGDCCFIQPKIANSRARKSEVAFTK